MNIDWYRYKHLRRLTLVPVKTRSDYEKQQKLCSDATLADVVHCRLKITNTFSYECHYSSRIQPTDQIAAKLIIEIDSQKQKMKIKKKYN